MTLGRVVERAVELAMTLGRVAADRVPALAGPARVQEARPVRAALRKNRPAQLSMTRHPAAATRVEHRTLAPGRRAARRRTREMPSQPLRAARPMR